jgi:hypothetical protein
VAVSRNRYGVEKTVDTHKMGKGITREGEEE